MSIRTVLLVLFFFNISLLAHKVPGMDVSLERKEANKVVIKAFFKKSKRALIGNEVKLISKFDNRVLAKGKLKLDGLTLDIPSESYWVFVIVRDNDLVKDGIAPNGGFKKEVEIKKIAFLYTSIVTLSFIILGIFIGYKKNKLFKKSIS